MNLFKMSLIALTVGALSLSVPAYAQTNNNGGGASNGGSSAGTNDNAAGGGQNALAGNGSNGAVGDNPNATDPTATCFRRDTAGHETKIVCPGNPSQTTNGSVTAPAQ
jgi:hypothetical protein